MTSKELLNCLKDRPCAVCKFRDEHGCHKWTCVFEEETEDEPKKGEWIMIPKVNKRYCSACKVEYRTTFSPHNFCPNCGAFMKGE